MPRRAAPGAAPARRAVRPRSPAPLHPMHRRRRSRDFAQPPRALSPHAHTSTGKARAGSARALRDVVRSTTMGKYGT
jgi:hypothetical protein